MGMSLRDASDFGAGFNQSFGQGSIDGDGSQRCLVGRLQVDRDPAERDSVAGSYQDDSFEIRTLQKAVCGSGHPPGVLVAGMGHEKPLEVSVEGRLPGLRQISFNAAVQGVPGCRVPGSGQDGGAGGFFEQGFRNAHFRRYHQNRKKKQDEKRKTQLGCSLIHEKRFPYLL